MRPFIHLKKRRPSRKDYSHRKTLGAANLVVPQSGTVMSFATEILDQGKVNKCTADTAVEIRKWKTKKTYDSEKYYLAELEMLGEKYNEGVDLETQGAVGVNIGWVPVGQNKPTDKASAYVFVNDHPFSGPDMFDILRATMMRVGPLSGGLDWYNDWTDAPGGIIPHSFKSLNGGHDIELAELAFINGVDYIGLQQSWGESHGKKGIYYLDRWMANKVFAEYGVLYWSDNPDLEFKRMGLLEALLVSLKNLLLQLVKWYNTSMDNQDDIRTIISNTASENGIEPSLALAVAECENFRFPGDVFDPKRTFQNKDKNGNVTSTDRGIFMWNDKYHPEVTDEMAFDPKISCKLFCDAVKGGKLHNYWKASQPCWSNKVSAIIIRKYI